MNLQEKKDYLKQYRQLDSEIRQLLLEKSEIFELGPKITPTYSAVPKGTGSGDKIQSTIEKLEKQEDKINQKIEQRMKVKEEIETALNTVTDQRLKLLLRYRYINGCTWEDIAAKMCYSYMHVYRLHGKALNAMML